jgi:hypothetical protein
VVGFVAEHVACFYFFDGCDGFVVLYFGVGFGGGVLFGEFNPDGEFFDGFGDGVVVGDPGFEDGCFF